MAYIAWLAFDIQVHFGHFMAFRALNRAYQTLLYTTDTYKIDTQTKGHSNQVTHGNAYRSSSLGLSPNLTRPLSPTYQR